MNWGARGNFPRCPPLTRPWLRPGCDLVANFLTSLSCYTVVASQLHGNRAFAVHASSLCYCETNAFTTVVKLTVCCCDNRSDVRGILLSFSGLTNFMLKCVNVVLMVVMMIFVCGKFKQMLTTFAQF